MQRSFFNRKIQFAIPISKKKIKSTQAHRNVGRYSEFSQVQTQCNFDANHKFKVPRQKY